MSTKPATRSSFQYWIFLFLACGVLAAGLAASSVVFSQKEWLNSLVLDVIYVICAFTAVLIIPRLLSLAIVGKDIEALKNFFCDS